MTARWRGTAAAAYLLVLVSAGLFFGVALFPDRLVVAFIPVVLLFGRLRAFLLDWLPFLVALLGYEYLRGLGSHLLGNVHFTTMLHLDQSLFGVVPTQYLQGRFFTPDHLHWYDYVATLFDFLHFVVPMVLGLFLWVYAPPRFKRFAFALLLLSVLALVTYITFPAAPPWLAGQNGYLPGVGSVLSHTLGSFPARLHLPTIYQRFDPDVVAAVPSLHAGYACLVALFLGRNLGWPGAVVGALYALAMCISLVYLGEHYVSDILIGCLYAGAAFTITSALWDFLPRWRFAPAEPVLAGN